MAMRLLEREGLLTFTPLPSISQLVEERER